MALSLSAALIMAAAALGSGAATPIPAPSIRLQTPLDCTFGKTCFIQQYFDHDPGPGETDYRCGSMTYNGHDGTDFRVPTLAAQRAGVAVLAAADGVIVATRDGMQDVSVALTGSASVAGRECGNGVMVAHPSGWQTQYCHMAKGSVAVKQGQAVKAGATLGQVGESGDAAFPHLHLNVFKDGVRVDPFAFGAPPGSCGGGVSLWTQEAARALGYHSPELINFGFADGAVTADDIEEGTAAARTPSTVSPAIVAFARAIGLRAGDVLSLQAIGPGGFSASSQPATLDHSKAQSMVFVGSRRPAAGWSHGVYRGRFTVQRAGVVVLDHSFEVTL